METPVIRENASTSRKVIEMIGIIIFAAIFLFAAWWAITEVIKEINNLPPFGIYP
jgi:hypothetical protein